MIPAPTPGSRYLGAVVATYSDIEGGWMGEGNFNLNPNFRDTYYDDFHLTTPLCGDSTTSPCIDRGISTITDQTLNCELGLGTNLSDLGAYGGENSDWQTGIDFGPPSLPERVWLHQNYPNPFNARTTIAFDLEKSAHVSLSVYDITGAKIATLFDGFREAGSPSIVWNAVGVSSGVYFARLAVGEETLSQRMVLLK